MDLIGTIESTFSRVNSTVFRQVNRVTDWWHLPTPVALLNLRGLRDDLSGVNLYDTRRRRGNGHVAPTSCPSTAPTTAPARIRPTPDGQGRHPLRPQQPGRGAGSRGAARRLMPEPAGGRRAAAAP